VTSRFLAWVFVVGVSSKTSFPSFLLFDFLIDAVGHMAIHEGRSKLVARSDHD
jgi:hypothetical protein